MSNLEEEIMIPPDTKRLRHDDSENENEDEDRLSNLHDCVLLHILSFLNTKHAVRTCILSTRWKHLWKRLPTLVLHRRDFSTLKIFTNFVSRILSFRDDSISLHALDFSHGYSNELPLLKKIVKYAISHNAQRLGLSVSCEIEQIQSSIFSCQTLTHLKLGGNGGTLFPKSLNLPSLTHLYLGSFAFRTDNDVADPFLTLNKLNSLVLSNCTKSGALTLRISSATLVHLSMNGHYLDFLNIELCTPSLCRCVFTGVPNMRFYGSTLSSVKQVDIDVELFSFRVKPAFNLFSWLVDFIGIKSLVLSASTLQVSYTSFFRCFFFLNLNFVVKKSTCIKLSLFTLILAAWVLSFIPDLLKTRLPFLENMKSLKVKNQELTYGLCLQLRDAKLQKAKSKKEATKLKKEWKANFTLYPPLPDGIVDFLLQNSPSAEVEIVDCPRLPFSWDHVDIIRDYQRKGTGAQLLDIQEHNEMDRA